MGLFCCDAIGFVLKHFELYFCSIQIKFLSLVIKYTIKYILHFNNLHKLLPATSFILYQFKSYSSPGEFWSQLHLHLLTEIMLGSV